MSALVFDLPEWTQIELTGRDRQSFLNGFCTNDVKKLQPGQGCEAFLANIKGRIIGHIRVFADDARLCLESEPGQAAAIIQHLDKYLISEDVQFVDRTNDWGLLLIAGESAAETLKSTGVCESPPQDVGAHVQPEGTGHVSIRRSDVLGEACWTMSVDAAVRDSLKSRLVAAGAESADPAKFESLRIEYGYPLFGVDLSEDNLVHESARVSQTVSFTKGCYLGQEPIARLDSLGHVNRHLCRLRFSAASGLSAGAKVWRTFDGERAEVGHITSAAPLTSSTDQNEWAAIALVKRDAATPGTELTVDLGLSVTADAVVAGTN